MTEKRARHASLIVIALEVGLLFVAYWLYWISWAMYTLTIQGNKPSVEMILLLLFFFIVGVLVILSAFFKIPFYVLSIGTIILMGLYVVYASFYIEAIFICLIALVPQISYYSVRLWLFSKNRKLKINRP